MTAVPEPVNQRLRLALAIATLGYRIFPLKPKTKEPATKHGFKDATSDVEQVRRWWTENPDYNIGLATGMQDNGMWVGVIDVDAKHGGVLAWKQLTRDHGGGWQRKAPIHRTPRDGYHVFGRADPALGLNSANGFPEGIDTRGDGGYVVLPDSVFVDPETGVIGDYRMTTNNLWEAEPQFFPDWTIERWQYRPEPPRKTSAERHPSTQPGTSPADWCRAHVSLQMLMESVGWTQAGGPDHEGRIPMTRPKKSTGVSGNINPSGESVYIFTTEIPAYARPFGRVGNDGLPNNYSAWDFLCGFVCKGDTTEAARLMFRQMPPPDTAGRVPAEAAAEPSAVALEVPQLPESFWQRPVLAHIRQAAWHYLASPDATLLHVMTRFATTVHPKWTLPMKGTLDVYGVVISPSGAGKGQANKAGRGLWPGPTRSRLIAMDQTPSSGEGLIEAFMGAQDKVTGERPVVGQAAHFIVDEGTTLIAQLGRDGATIIGTLCSAWVGEALGQLLSDRNRSRYIPPLTVRVCSTINIQNELAGQLYSDVLKATGFTGRCTFVCGQDPKMPDVPVDDPGPLKLMDWSAPPTYSGVLSYPSEVHAAVREEILAGHRGTLDRDPRQSHRILQRVKWSMILAMMDGRQEMSLEDWALGGDLLTLSGAVLTMLDAQHATTAKQQSFAKLQTRAEAEAFVDDTKATHVVRRVERWVLGHIPKGDGIGFKALRRKTDGPSRMAYDEAVDNLVREGKVLRSADDVLTLP